MSCPLILTGIEFDVIQLSLVKKTFYLAQGVRKKNLGRCLNPDFWIRHFSQIRNHVVVNTLPSIWKSNSSDQKNQKHHNRKRRRKVDHL